MPSGSQPRRSRHSVNLFQALALLLAFVLLSGVGGVLMAGLVAPVAATAGALTRDTTDIFDELPENLEIGAVSEASFIYASDGVTPLATYFDDAYRIVVPLEKISPHLQNAVVAIEDKRFYEHGGVDPKGTLRAFVNNITSDGDGDTQGGSTLTQQYVKNVLVDKANREGDLVAVEEAKAPTEARKLREAKLAIGIEKSMTKDEILAGYLNIAQFGRGINGVEAAARRYFGKSTTDLSILEAATIAGITQSPSALDPTQFPDASQRRRDVVLKEMWLQGYISQQEYQDALSVSVAESLNVQPINKGCMSAQGGAGFFCDYVVKVILQDPAFGDTPEARKELLERGGLTIITTIDLNKQAIADEELRVGIPTDDPNGFADALTSLDPKTGEILVMAQNRTYDASEVAEPGGTSVNFNTGRSYGGSSGFQSGSTFKAFVLAEWLEEGHTLRDTVDANTYNRSFTELFGGTPSSCTDFNARDSWDPQNSDGRGSGSRTVLQATAQSINTAYVSMQSKIDMCAVGALASRIGFASAVDKPVEIIPSMVLGVQETTPLSMASAYATFAASGMHCDPVAILSVTHKNPETLAVEPITPPQANCRQALSTSTANAVTYALQQVLAPGGGGSKFPLAGGRAAAGKTGTTNLSVAAWFVGYTPDLVTAVWTGHPDGNVEMRNVTIAGNTYRNVFGSSIALPTWKRYMDRALEGYENVGFADIAPSQLGNLPAPPPAETTDPTAPAIAPPADPAPATPDTSGE